MNKQKQMLKYVENILSNIEADLKRAKTMLQQLQHADEQGNIPESNKPIINPGLQLESYEEDNTKVIEGVFDGYFMIGGDTKKYPVPTNYASKSKLVPGDQLKLKIMEDGKLIYKLTHPADRKHCKAIISLDEHKKFTAITDQGEIYHLNQAAVTFFKGQPGDEAYIIANTSANGGYAAIETIIKPHHHTASAPVVISDSEVAPIQPTQNIAVAGSVAQDLHGEAPATPDEANETAKAE